ncbi:MAG TPA: glutamine--fructose-6-phosphate transaminase (isomerizing) [Chloroflexota bacterium]
MCGIFGFVSSRNRPASEVLAGLRFLEYRGYDSWGIACAGDRRVQVDKAVGPIADATTTLAPSRAALGHTRWATHGGVTHANAHPHCDCHGRLALIHNGIVENHQELRAGLNRSHDFRSQTDTEVLVHLLEEALEEEPTLTEALVAVFRRVEGLSAIAVLDAESGSVAAAKNGSPLALGWGEDGCYLASDPIAMAQYTRRITFLEDGQGAVISDSGIDLFDAATGEELRPHIRTIDWDVSQSGLDGFPHFMIKEIHEQPAVLNRIAHDGPQRVARLAELIKQSDDVYLIGCGTAHHAAMSARYTLAQIAGKNVNTAAASEMSLLLPLMKPGSLVIALSQSGETIDVLDAVKAARALGATIAAVVNAEGSSLDRVSDETVLLGCGPERCVLATKSYTAKLAVFHMIAHVLRGDPVQGQEDLRLSAERIECLLQRESATGALHETALKIADQQHMFILGRHSSYPLALEAALKIKEVSYLHAEGFAAGELKHGVIALVTYGTPCLLLASDPKYLRESMAAASEVRARGALTIGLSTDAVEEFDIHFPVSQSAASPYEVAITAQLLAYELALIRGCDPDKPRNLAKSVTVR